MKLIMIFLVFFLSISLNAKDLTLKEELISQITSITEQDNIFLKQINDTLFYGQIFPGERFPIFIVNNEFCIPISTSDSVLVSTFNIYRHHFKSNKMLQLDGVDLLVPTNIIKNYLKDISIENSSLKIKDVSDCGLEYLEGLYGAIRLSEYIKSPDEIIIGFRSKRMVSSINGELVGVVSFDNTSNTVIITPGFKSWETVLAMAGYHSGIIKIKPPNSKFKLQIDKDTYTVAIKDSMIAIVPDSLAWTIIIVE